MTIAVGMTTFLENFFGKVSRKEREKACPLMIENNADVRGADLRKTEATDQKHTTSGLVHKVKEFFKSERSKFKPEGPFSRIITVLLQLTDSLLIYTKATG